MGVIADVIFAVAVVAVAPGAIAELQLGVGYIGPSTHCTAVGIVPVSAVILMLGGSKGHDSGAESLRIGVFALAAPQLCPPGKG